MLGLEHKQHKHSHSGDIVKHMGIKEETTQIIRTVISPKGKAEGAIKYIVGGLIYSGGWGVNESKAR